MRIILCIVGVLVSVVSPVEAEGKGMRYWVFPVVWQSSHPEKDQVLIESIVRFDQASLKGGHYQHYNRLRDEQPYDRCFTFTQAYNSPQHNYNKSDFGWVQSTGQRSYCDRINDCSATDICWACLGDDEPNVYWGRAYASVVKYGPDGSISSIVTDQSNEWDREGENRCDYSPTPIVIDLDGATIRLSAPAVEFDIDNDGELETVGWTRLNTGEAFLALDRNENGSVDNGSELFGDATPMLCNELAEHGFQALAEFDAPEHGGNADGMISAADEIFSSLLLWSDLNRDGVSSGDELRTTVESGLISIDLDFVENRHRDPYGNEFRYNSRARVVVDGKTKNRNAADVFLVTED